MGIAVTIDDSKVVLMLMGKMLSDKGFEVQKASSGEEGVELIKKLYKDGIDIVFIDYNMEGLDGIETAQKIIEFVDPKKVCLLTANIQEATQAKARNLGIHFASKPLDPKILDELTKA